MPYPNEHACRVREPGEFVRFFRKHVKDENDVGDYKATGKPYDLIMGYRTDDSSDVQSHRYPTSDWTAEEARAHCKAHKGISFEPASGSSGSSSATLQEEGWLEAEEGEEKLDQVSIRPRTYVPARLINTPWAITAEKLAVLQTVFTRYMRGEKLDPEEVQMVVHGAKRPADRRVGKIAVLPLFGSIFPRANLMTNTSGATSAEVFGSQFDELVKNPDVSAIVLDVDSPGGQASGIPELSKKIYQARSKKPIVAVANHDMDSAAYWIGSSASEVSVTPSGELGSIGVYAAHDDVSESLKQEGIKRTLISAGKYKTEGNPWEPLSEEAKATIQTGVDEFYDAFVKDVARNRGVKVADVRNGFGEGRVVGAHQAVELGMADRIETLDEAILRLQKSLFSLSPEQKQQAEDLRIKVNQILEKEKTQ